MARNEIFRVSTIEMDLNYNLNLEKYIKSRVFKINSHQSEVTENRLIYEEPTSQLSELYPLVKIFHHKSYC